MGEAVPEGCPEEQGTLKFQSRLQMKAESRSTPKNGPLGQLTEAGQLVAVVEEEDQEEERAGRQMSVASAGWGATWAW